MARRIEYHETILSSHAIPTIPLRIFLRDPVIREYFREIRHPEKQRKPGKLSESPPRKMPTTTPMNNRILSGEFRKSHRSLSLVVH
jgi:hypothetical protein